MNLKAAWSALTSNFVPRYAYYVYYKRHSSSFPGQCSNISIKNMMYKICFKGHKRASHHFATYLNSPYPVIMFDKSKINLCTFLKSALFIIDA